MSTARKLKLTPQEYLAVERRAHYRSEYFDGEMFAMAGTTWEHTLVKDNFAAETRARLKDGPCRVVTSDLRVKIDATGLYAYPDVTIVCDKPRFEDNEFDTLLNPTAIVEVLSKSSESYDCGAKFGHYRQLPSIREYVLVSQDRPLVERYVRQPDNSWLLTVYDKPNDTFEFASINARIPLAEIYRGVTFPAVPA